MHPSCGAGAALGYHGLSWCQPHPPSSWPCPSPPRGGSYCKLQDRLKARHGTLQERCGGRAGGSRSSCNMHCMRSGCSSVESCTVSLYSDFARSRGICAGIGQHHARPRLQTSRRAHAERRDASWHGGCTVPGRRVTDTGRHTDESGDLVARDVPAGAGQHDRLLRVHRRVRENLRGAGMIYLTAAVSLFLFIYLFAALIRPEWF